ncbi:MAG: asparaginase [Chloracidobacterium sp.]|nr:asparaginase [Chloracidobacterium sp.]MCO5334784.1 asparaginase [Pyrinomonadaceae bacterium]
MSADIIARVIRGNTVESIHRGHLLILDGARNVIASAGDIDTVVYYRSSAKAFQAIPLITSGAADAFGFTEAELALAAASHSGEAHHVEIAASMLAKAGFTEADLRCGSHLPFSQPDAHRLIAAGETPSQIYNNCSGKHAAMLAFARHIGADTADYDSPTNRIQKRILRCIAEFAEVSEESIAVGVDGCSAPNFALPLRSLAVSYLNLLDASKFHEVTNAAAKRIVAAMLNHPELIGGTGRLDTRLMQAGHAKLISKVGADGVWLCGVLPSERWANGLAIALKVEDGDDHKARPVVAADILRRLGVVDGVELADMSPMAVKSRRGETVGQISTALDLQI